MLLPPSSTVRARKPLLDPLYVHQERSYSPPRGEAIPVSCPELAERRSYLPSGALSLPVKTISFSYHRVRFPVMQCAMCQRLIEGLVWTRACTWARKSASVRVGPQAGTGTWPVTTSRLRTNERVPCRIYSNSRRCTLPGASGKSGCLRSRACTPVNSSVLTVASPCLAKTSACWYTWQMARVVTSLYSSSGGVNQYRLRWGFRSPFLTGEPHAEARSVQQFLAASLLRQFPVPSTG